MHIKIWVSLTWAHCSVMCAPKCFLLIVCALRLIFLGSLCREGYDGQCTSQALDIVHWRAFINMAMNLRVPQRKAGNFLSSLF